MHVTEGIVLCLPRMKDEKEALAYRAEHFEAREMTIHGDGGLDEARDYRLWVEKVERDRFSATGRTLPRRAPSFGAAERWKTRAPATTEESFSGTGSNCSPSHGPTAQPESDLTTKKPTGKGRGKKSATATGSAGK